MANEKKISQLDSATTAGDSDLLILDQAGVTKKVTRLNLLGSGGNTQSGTYSTVFGWYNTVTVEHSGAFGFNNTVNGRGANAVGTDNTASGEYSNVFGSYNVASGYDSVAVGIGNNSTGTNSVAFGIGCTASGDLSIAIGYQAQATDEHAIAVGGSGSSGISAFGEYSAAFGYDCIANSDNTTAIGNFNQSLDLYATSVGASNIASGIASTAIGFDNTASGEGSTACGYSNSASSYQNVVFGAYNTASGEEKNTAIGWGNTTNDRHCSAVGFSNTTSTNYASAFGYTNSATGYLSSAFGANNTASNQWTNAFGYSNVASETNASAFGNRLEATGYATTACGYSSTASGTYASVFGSYNESVGTGTLACGYNNFAGEDRSNAVGWGCNAQHYMASALGSSNTASGLRSSAVGSGNTASGYYAAALGFGNTSSGFVSTAVGINNNCTNDQSIAFGLQNDVTGPRCSVVGSYNTAHEEYGVADGLANKVGVGSTAFGALNSSLGLRSNTLGQYNHSNVNSGQAIGSSNFAGFVNWDTTTYTITNNSSNSSIDDPGSIINIADTNAVCYELLSTRLNNGIATFIKITDSGSGANIDGVYSVSNVGQASNTTFITLYEVLPSNADNITGGTVYTGTDLVDLQLANSLAAIVPGSGGSYVVNGDAGFVQKFLDKSIPVYFYADGGKRSVLPLSGVSVGGGGSVSTVYTSAYVPDYSISGNVKFATSIAWANQPCDDTQFDLYNIAGLATNQIIVVPGDQRNIFANSDFVWLYNDTNGTTNNGIYDVVAVAYDNTYTRISINQILPNPSETENYGTLLPGSYVSKKYMTPVAVGQQNVSTGIGSTALGVRNNAFEFNTTALGYKNTASGCYSQAVGAWNVADAIGAISFGSNNTVSGNNAVAFGVFNEASGENAIAFGHNTTSSYYRSVAFGYSCTSSSYRSVAMGYSNVASGYWSSSIGQSNNTSGGFSSALGFNNTASGEYATACGYNNTASSTYSVAIGNNNSSTDNTAVAFGFNNTVSGSNASSVGVGNHVNHTRGSAFGYGNNVSANYSSAFGYANEVSVARSSAFGFNNTASGPYASAFGYACTASNVYASAFGYNSTASAYYSTALGGSAVARIESTTNIGGAIIVRKDNDEESIIPVLHYAGVENVIMSQATTLTATNQVSCVLPIGSSFFIDECGLIITHAVNVTDLPTISFGAEMSYDTLVSPVKTTGLTTANSRQRFTSVNDSSGHVQLNAAITTAATADNLVGRFYWKGILVEDTVVQVPQFSVGGEGYTSPIALTLTSNYIDGTSIYYTTDGSAPTPSSTLYEGSIVIYTTQTITALGVSSRGQWSDISDPQTYTMTVAEPSFSVAGGSYNAEQSVTITCTTGPASIYYTTDGSDPDDGSTLYTGPVAITSSLTLKAIAVLAGANDSPIHSASYSLFCIDPEFTVDTGTYNNEQGLILTAGSGNPIYFTSNGDTPDDASVLYLSPIILNGSQTIKAISIRAGWTSSNVVSKTYTFVCADPTESPEAGTYYGTQSIDLSSITTDAAIYYTTDGSTPTTGSTLYTGSIELTSSGAGGGGFSMTAEDILFGTPPGFTAIKAIATKNGYNDSNTVEFDYTINDPTVPSLTTDGLTSHFNFTATADGTITDDGGGSLTDYGFVWNTTGSPNLSDNIVSVGSGTFTGAYSQLIGGLPGATVYIAAYATNSQGTTFGTTLSVYPGPCLMKGTQITLADGTKKNIEDVTYNDNLLVWNFDEGKLDEAKPVWIAKPWTANEYAIVKFSNGSELGTVDDGKGHRIFNMNKMEFTHLMNEDTQVGTTTFNESGEILSVVGREAVNEPTTFYNIITDKHINVFANNILTSTGLNNIYPVVDMKFVKDDKVVRWSKEEFGVSDEIFNGLRLAEQPMNYPDLVNKINRLVDKMEQKI